MSPPPPHRDVFLLPSGSVALKNGLFVWAEWGMEATLTRLTPQRRSHARVGFWSNEWPSASHKTSKNDQINPEFQNFYRLVGFVVCGSELERKKYFSVNSAAGFRPRKTETWARLSEDGFLHQASSIRARLATFTVVLLFSCPSSTVH